MRARSGAGAAGALRWAVGAVCLIGLATTVGAMAIAFVPSADEQHPAIAVLKVAGMTMTLLLAGAAIYFAGSARARRRARLAADPPP